MKTSISKILSCLIVAIVFVNCSNDDDINTPELIIIDEDQETENTVATIIAGLTDNQSKVWKIDVAQPSSSTSNVANLYNIKDDEFTFSVGSTPSQLLLSWNKGFAINSGTTAGDITSDSRISSQIFEMNIQVLEDANTIANPSNSFNVSYDIESQEISGTLSFQDDQAPLSVVLTEKQASDYASIATSVSNPSQLLEFETGVFRVGFKLSQAENSLFITNRNDLIPFGQLAFKIDLNTNVSNEMEFTQQDFATKNIEFLNDQVVSIGGGVFEIFDYAFENPILTEVINNEAVSNGSASLDGQAYLFGGLVDGSLNSLATWSIDQTDFINIAALPFELNDLDGEIVDQKLYMFGGWEGISFSDFGSNIVHIYDLNNDSFSQVTIPISLRETYTSVVENLIYVAGLNPEDIDGDGEFDQITPYLGVFDTLTSTMTDVSLEVGDIFDNTRLIHFQTKEGKAYFITSETLSAPDGFINRVYEADLN